MKDIKKVHFVGIGGAGMSGIAKVMLEMSYKVSGSDLKESANTQALRRWGAKVIIGHSSKNVGPADVVVYSSAIPAGNSELKAAKKKGIPLFPRAKMLAELSRDKTVVAVAGTHGKTTTTSMISMCLQRSGLDPTFLIGGELNDVGSNAKCGKGKYFVAEADESDGSFLYLNSNVVILTNVEPDHLDYFKSFEHIKKTFLEFAELLSEDGHLVACGDSSTVEELIARVNRQVITYGLDKKNDFCGEEVSLDRFSSKFKVLKKGKVLGEVHLKVPGIHNVLNGLATVAFCLSAGLDFKQVSKVLSQFNGVKRRFQVVGTFSGVTLVDDYAHHPTEVKATLRAAKSGDWARVICVFQPHRFTRTKFLKESFANAFGQADVLILTDIYAAGEEPIPGVSGKLLVDVVLDENPRKEVVYLPKKPSVSKYLKSTAEVGDLVLTVGAGDIWTVGERLAKSLRQEIT